MRSQHKTDLPQLPRALPAQLPATSFSDEALLLTDAPLPARASSAAPADLETEVITDWPRLASLEEEWLELAAASCEANPFYEPWMLLPALRAYASGARLEVLVVSALRRGRRELCGLFPLSFRRGRGELWKHRSCYLATPLLRASCAREALGSFFDYLERSCGLVRLDDVPGDGPFHLLLVDELNRRGWPSLVSHSYTRAFFRPAPTAEQFLERALNGKRRKELRRQRARLSELGHLEVCELGPDEDPAPWIREFLALEASGWKGERGVAAALHPAEREYVEEVATRAHQRGRLMMMGLRLDGRPVALKYNLLAGSGAFAFKIAFDESFSRYSPGVLLELENIHRLHRMPGVRWMDSCAAPNRFMINHLWPERREMQTLFFSTGRALPSLVLALVPLLQYLRARARRRRAGS
ncbi:MAG TPA: GNAT family N-acetyltransferase [Myxococcales bacterium]|nr:GNAT family N-acetyltransferase [Myxococcales bacterium]